MNIVKNIKTTSTFVMFLGLLVSSSALFATTVAAPTKNIEVRTSDSSQTWRLDNVNLTMTVADLKAMIHKIAYFRGKDLNTMKLVWRIKDSWGDTKGEVELANDNQLLQTDILPDENGFLMISPRPVVATRPATTATKVTAAPRSQVTIGTVLDPINLKVGDLVVMVTDKKNKVVGKITDIQALKGDQNMYLVDIGKKEIYYTLSDILAKLPQ